MGVVTVRAAGASARGQAAAAASPPPPRPPQPRASPPPSHPRPSLTACHGCGGRAGGVQHNPRACRPVPHSPAHPPSSPVTTRLQLACAGVGARCRRRPSWGPSPSRCHHRGCGACARPGHPRAPSSNGGARQGLRGAGDNVSGPSPRPHVLLPSHALELDTISPPTRPDRWAGWRREGLGAGARAGRRQPSRGGAQPMARTCCSRCGGGRARSRGPRRSTRWGESGQPSRADRIPPRLAAAGHPVGLAPNTPDGDQQAGCQARGAGGAAGLSGGAGGTAGRARVRVVRGTATCRASPPTPLPRPIAEAAHQ